MNRDELRTAILRRADMYGSDFVSEPELDAWIDISIAELHGILRSKYGDEYFAKTTWIQVNPGSNPNIAWPRTELNVESPIPGPDLGFPASYPLPDDFQSLLRCQFLRGTVSRANVQIAIGEDVSTQATENWTLSTPDRHAYPMSTIDSIGDVIDFTPRSWVQCLPQYRLRSGPVRQLSLSTYVAGQPVYSEVWHNGTVIEFLPVPAEQYAVQVTYVQSPQLLPDHPHIGYVICGVAAMCLSKQQQDPSALLAEQGKTVQLITGPNATKDAANPKRVIDRRGVGIGRRRGRGYWDEP